MTSLLNKCRTAVEVRSAVNKYFNANNIKTKYSLALQRKLRSETNFDKALQAAWNYYLNQFNPVKPNDMKVVRYKGSAIGGMECHSFGH